MRFTKPALSHDAQLDLLIERGLSVPERQRALHYLKHINYYRLGAYWLPFEVDHSTHRFQLGTTFDDVLNLYVFDREFRLLMMDAIERVEVSVRAAWAYHMAHEYGPHCHLNPSIFNPKNPKWDYGKHKETLAKEVRRSQEIFIRHLRDTYDESLPPIWALVEIMSFGQLSQWYKNTRHRRDRNAVARQYGLDEKVLTSFLHHLTTMRNLCAHHSRLWNREFTVIPKMPTKGHAPLLESLNLGQKRRIYNTMTLVLYLMDQISPRHHWRDRVIHLLSDYAVPVRAMGFPKDWQKRPLWGASS